MHFSLALALPQKGHRPTYESQFKCHFVLHVHIGNVLKSNLLQSVWIYTSISSPHLLRFTATTQMNNKNNRTHTNTAQTVPGLMNSGYLDNLELFLEQERVVFYQQQILGSCDIILGITRRKLSTKQWKWLPTLTTMICGKWPKSPGTWFTIHYRFLHHRFLWRAAANTSTGK